MQTITKPVSANPLLLAVAGSASGVAGPAGPATGAVAGLIARIKDPDEAISGAAWQSAALYGAAAVKPLAMLMAESDYELARKAKRALYRIVRQVSHPAAGQQRKSVELELIPLLTSAVPQVRREVVWMLSEIGGPRAIAPIATLLSDKEVREDARCALTRHPAAKAVRALRSAFTAAPEEFKPALAESLRERGEKVGGYSTRKLVPTAQTSVTPLQPKRP